MDLECLESIFGAKKNKTAFLRSMMDNIDVNSLFEESKDIIKDLSQNAFASFIYFTSFNYESDVKIDIERNHPENIKRFLACVKVNSKETSVIIDGGSNRLGIDTKLFFDLSYKYLTEAEIKENFLFHFKKVTLNNLLFMKDYPFLYDEKKMKIDVNLIKEKSDASSLTAHLSNITKLDFTNPFDRDIFKLHESIDKLKEKAIDEWHKTILSIIKFKLFHLGCGSKMTDENYSYFSNIMFDILANSEDKKGFEYPRALFFKTYLPFLDRFANEEKNKNLLVGYKIERTYYAEIESSLNYQILIPLFLKMNPSFFDLSLLNYQNIKKVKNKKEFIEQFYFTQNQRINFNNREIHMIYKRESLLPPLTKLKLASFFSDKYLEKAGDKFQWKVEYYQVLEDVLYNYVDKDLNLLEHSMNALEITYSV